MSDASMIGKIYGTLSRVVKSAVGFTDVGVQKISHHDMTNNLAPEVLILNNPKAMEDANAFFLSLNNSDQKRAVETLSQNLQDVMRKNDQKVLLRFFLFRLRLIASAIHRTFDVKSSLIKLFDDICARLLSDPDDTVAYLEDLALSSDARLSVKAGFTSLIESVSPLHRPDRSIPNLKILLLSDLIISKHHSVGFFRSLIGSKWFQYVMSNGHPEDPMVVFHLITKAIATGNCFTIERGEYILAMTKLVIKWAPARPIERCTTTYSTAYETRTNNIKNQLLEFFSAAECFRSIPHEDLKKILRCACDGIIMKDALVMSAVAASDFAFSLEKTRSCSYSGDLCTVCVDIMIEYILLNLLDTYHANKRIVWCAIEEVDAMVQERGSLQIKLMFQVK